MEFHVTVTAQMDITGEAPDNFVLVLLFVSKPPLLPLIHLMVPHIHAIIACGIFQYMTPMVLCPIKPVLKTAQHNPIFHDLVRLPVLHVCLPPQVITEITIIPLINLGCHHRK